MLTHKGKSYARVSEILSPLCDFSKIDPCVLARKTIIGSNVHQAISDDIAGEFPMVTPLESPYFRSYMKWRMELSPEFLQSEKRYFDDKKRITGCIDALISFKDSPMPILIDFKTSAQESKTWILQAHLYYHLLTEAQIGASTRFLFIKLDKNGNLPKVFQYNFDPNIFNKCMSLIDLYFSSTK